MYGIISLTGAGQLALCAPKRVGSRIQEGRFTFLGRSVYAVTSMSMNTSHPIVKDIVLVGGGHAHVAVLRSFGMQPVPGVRLSLITKDVHTAYSHYPAESGKAEATSRLRSGMLPGFVAGFYDYDDCHVDLLRLATFAQARFIHGEATGLDTQGRKVLLKGRPPIPYDILSLDVGISPGTGGVPGVMAHAIPVKPVSNFVDRLRRLRARAAALDRPCRLVVVGGGAGGVEIAASLHHALSQETPTHPPHVCLITKGRILASHPSAARTKFLRIMQERGIVVREGVAVEAVEEGKIKLVGGEVLPYDECCWCTGAAAPAWLRDTDLPLDSEGFVSIDATMRCAGGPTEVFAVGDMATSVVHPRPKAGVYAVRQGPPLADNIRRLLRGEALRGFVPQSTHLSIITTGDRYAVATKGWICLEGAWLWRWKDHIDRTWMGSYGDHLPRMEEGAMTRKAGPATALSSPEEVAILAASRMRCAGCGGKVASSVLSRALYRLPPQSLDPDVVVGLDAPDDAALIRPPPPGNLLVQTVDFFRSFVDDPYVFGAIAANHALGDCHAMGARARTALAIVTLPYASNTTMEEDLYQLLSGACSVLEPAGCSLVGGHTGEGSDLSLGFSVEGMVKEADVLRKGGMQVGQALILTKAVGTGVLLAGAMRGIAKGRWLAGAWASMQQSSEGAAECAREAAATAATDVTGFGLVGHLLEMLHASKVGAELDMGAVPLMEGALECAAAGVASSIYPDNARAASQVENVEICSSHPAWPLLFDPQTGGGLLLSVPSHHAPACIESLIKRGFNKAAVIGKITQPSIDKPIRVVLGQ